MLSRRRGRRRDRRASRFGAPLRGLRLALRARDQLPLPRPRTRPDHPRGYDLMLDGDLQLLRRPRRPDLPRYDYTRWIAKAIDDAYPGEGAARRRLRRRRRLHPAALADRDAARLARAGARGRRRRRRARRRTARPAHLARPARSTVGDARIDDARRPRRQRRRRRRRRLQRLHRALAPDHVGVDRRSAAGARAGRPLRAEHDRPARRWTSSRRRPRPCSTPSRTSA